MNYEDKLQNVSVLGAAGKMGSGILLLTALELADLQLKPENKSKPFIINAIDVSPAALSGLFLYLKTQIKKIAEKKVVQLRVLYSDQKELIENSEIIDRYVDDVLKLVLFSTRVESSYDSRVIFEAIVEDVDIKVKVFKQILANNPHKPWFLTNTSSVPIGELDQKADMVGNIIGFHFYNPPAVQKLVELITSQSTNPELIEFSKTYAKSIRKIIVPSNDFAGFIGNGHFMRDLLFGIYQAERLSTEMALTEAIFAVNKVSQDFLIRPMGIFQLIDYVGVDVCQKILRVMNSRLMDDSLHSKFIDTLIEQGVKGGQNADGTQKDGILQYQKGRPIGVWDIGIQCYVHIDTFANSVENMLGELPKLHKPWKVVIGDRQKDSYLKNYFSELNEMRTLGATLAKEYHQNSNNIGLGLVSNGIADSDENVNTVMLTGFFHAYGPINSYLD
jgi:3-hydroxyacyl-CoA dehydrogenase